MSLLLGANFNISPYKAKGSLLLIGRTEKRCIIIIEKLFCAFEQRQAAFIQKMYNAKPFLPRVNH